jgi:hypothetical protein
MTMAAAALAVLTAAALASGALAASAAPVSAHKTAAHKTAAHKTAAHKTAACDAGSGAGLPASGTLTSVVAFSACDVWAAGDQGTHSLVVHWNGRGWTLVRSGVMHWDYGGQPVTIGGTSDRDIWLVTVNADGKAVVEHWNGARFSQVHLPLPAGTKGEQLNGVSAVSPTDAWVAGYYAPAAGGTATLVEHWNGRAWSVTASANPFTPSEFGTGPDDFLYGVSARRDGAAWAVGTYFNGVTDGQSTLTEHWNGQAWTWVKSPDAARNNQLSAVSSDSPSDAWAVGFKNGLPNQALVEHWNGTAWQVVTFPDPGRDGKNRPASMLTGVSALSPADVWVCGSYPVKGGQVRTLLAHWNGTSWQQVATPASVKVTNVLNAISATGADDVWSVGGTTTVKGVQQPIALRHS